MSDYPDFIKGAIMAYKDCADFAKHMANNLPPEIGFLQPQFEDLAKGFREKAENIKLTANEMGF